MPIIPVPRQTTSANTILFAYVWSRRSCVTGTSIARTKVTKGACVTVSIVWTISSLCLLGYFSSFFIVCCCCFFKLTFFEKNSLRDAISMSNCLDPDEAWHSVEPDLGSNCLQRSSVDKKRCHLQVMLNNICINPYHMLDIFIFYTLPHFISN